MQPMSKLNNDCPSCSAFNICVAKFAPNGPILPKYLNVIPNYPFFN